MLVNVEEGELFAGFTGLEVGSLQHNDQPLLLLFCNLDKNRCSVNMDFYQNTTCLTEKGNLAIWGYNVYNSKKFSLEQYLGSSSLFNSLTVLTSCNLALLSHHMNVGSEEVHEF